ncbi:NAD(P)-dependent dehydrogenase (short-subunit alcohol dehydrogenase family) [Silvibacterium bohemicum]|uniref:NAD(P)-dependent dehydrogenase (Short-subunit alcohol dehydrogenase family) n=1 Tax=Silvibacterium bohemicum TaxID=1577686 RepID=A0A841K0E5_9BACT|nr:SDR family oxidoreductase [Silvibacterium bohemicum]MBB6146435.1 NAD(P)-dependent dehydrogenase (short-subunit alcohol dehydrogenase family) [Silvibacterium bohemicum]
MNWTAQNIPQQNGKLAIVTGATGGIGYETALALAMAGAEVIVAARNPQKGRDALARIAGHRPAGKVRFEEIDLASLASVSAFAERILAENRPLDLLINNAGVMAPPTRKTTADGFELQFGTNHLAHFALTAKLLPALRRASRPRVTNVSSLAHRAGAKILFDNLQAEHGYKPWPFYQQSKLANMLFTFEMQRRSDAAGWGLLVDAAHPGFARTDLIANGPGANSLQAKGSRILSRFLSHDSLGGALPTLYAAASPDASPNGYYGPNGFYEMKGPVAPAYIAPRAKDAASAKRLWEISEKLTGVRWG